MASEKSGSHYVSAEAVKKSSVSISPTHGKHKGGEENLEMGSVPPYMAGRSWDKYELE